MKNSISRTPHSALRILIVRTDRVGDVLLTTPVSRAIRAQEPDATIAWLVQSYTAPLLEHNPDVNEILVDDKKPINELIQQLKERHFDAALVAYPRWRIAWAVWRAGIPLRIGPASKWYSLFFTHRLYQHRSRGLHHEADYNLRLLEPLNISSQRVPTRFELMPQEKEHAHKTLEGLRATFQKPLVVLHPGSGGSSARWPLAHFMALGDRLQLAGCEVVVTAGPGEDYQYRMIDQMHRIPMFIAGGSVSLRELAAIYSCVDLVVSNSTGPLHLAVALGIPTVSIYSPVAACHPQRWGPYPAFVEGDKRHSVVMGADNGLAEVDLSTVSVETVWERCQQQLSAKGFRPGHAVAS